MMAADISRPGTGKAEAGKHGAAEASLGYAIRHCLTTKQTPVRGHQPTAAK